MPSQPPHPRDDPDWPEDLPGDLDDLTLDDDEPSIHPPELNMPPPTPEEEQLSTRLTRERAKQLDDEMRARLLRLSGIGVDFVVALVVMGGLGMAADYWLKTKPWLLLVGIGLGLAAGFYRFIKAANAANRDFRPPK